MWPVLVQLLPNTVKKTLLEDTMFFPHDAESREDGEAEEEPCGPFLWKGMGDPYCGAACIQGRAWSACGETHGKWDHSCLFLSGRINLSV